MHLIMPPLFSIFFTELEGKGGISVGALGSKHNPGNGFGIGMCRRNPLILKEYMDTFFIKHFPPELIKIENSFSILKLCLIFQNTIFNFSKTTSGIRRQSKCFTVNSELQIWT